MATAKKSPIQTAVDLLKKNGYTVTNLDKYMKE